MIDIGSLVKFKNDSNGPEEKREHYVVENIRQNELWRDKDVALKGESGKWWPKAMFELV